MINIDDFWKEAKFELSKELNSISYDVWIDKLEPVCFVKNSLILSTYSHSAKKTIDSKYLDTIKSVITKLNPLILGVEIIIDTDKDSYLQKQDSFIEDEGLIVKNDQTDEPNSPKFLERYTFENFVRGRSNELALEAAKAVCDDLGGKYNPLFIYSSAGLGKTHLLHAIGNHLKKTNPRIKIIYTDSNTFINEIIYSIRTAKDNVNSTNEIREKYRNTDILMIDDIQFVSGKEGTQEAFFNIFNDLYQNKKQIVLTADCAPNNLQKLSDRLRTRFSWGLIADIQPPNTETRIAILKNYAAREKFSLSDEVAEYIADKSTTNIREMEGLLNKIIFYSSLTNRVVDTIDLAKEALCDFIEDKKETIEESDILSAVCTYFNITNQQITGKSKTKDIVEPRMIAMYLMSDMLGVPLVSIGKIFGGRDHTTVMHARDKITEEIKQNTRMRIIISDIKNSLRNR
ncbi:MAG: chromosomal replication initiator protein DnaA [Christensenellales bacterium]